MRAFNRHGFLCASTDYRLSGVTILDQITDVRHGYDLFHTRLKRLGLPPRVFVHGSSAGAHLGALLTLALPGECGEDTCFRATRLENEWVRPVGAALQATPVRFEPWEDIFPHGWTAMQRIVGTPYEQAPEKYRRVSPIEYVSRESSPVFFLEAKNEHMFPLEYTREFVEKMRALGRRAECKVYRRAEHGFFYDVTRRAQKEAFADTLAFIESLT
jgi:acetyl esterase/lipase